MNDARSETPPQDPHVQAVLRQYLERLDSGENVDRDEFLEQHADVADELRSFLNTEEQLRQLMNKKSDSRIYLIMDEIPAHGDKPSEITWKFGKTKSIRLNDLIHDWTPYTGLDMTLVTNNTSHIEAKRAVYTHPNYLSLL